VGGSNPSVAYSVPSFDWYVNSVGGNDANTGKSQGQALQTITTLLSKSITAGQRIGLARGSTFRETLTVPVSSLTINGYGSGGAPIISGVPLMSGVAEETGGLFVSGLEDEVDACTVDFTQKNTAAGNTVTVATSLSRTGAKSLQVEFAGTGFVANAQKTLAAPATEVYARTWIYLDQAFSMAATGNQVYLLSMYDNVASGYPFLVGINSVNRKEHSWLYVAIQRAAGFTFIAAPALMTPGVWHSLEVHWVSHATTGGAQVWWDGVSVGSDFTRDTSAYSGRQLFLGGYTGNHAPAAGSKLYFDDVKLSATGPLSDGVTRRANAIDLNSKSNLVFQNIDLQNAGTTNFKSASATYSASGVRSMYVEPWTAAADATLPQSLAILNTYGAAIGASAIAPDGTMYLIDALSHVKRSTDGGATWATIKTFPDALLSGQALTVDSRGYIHASAHGGASSSGIWTSTDNGSTFTLNLDTTALAQPGGFWSIEEDADGRLFAGYYHSHAASTGAIIYRSTNGVDWTEAWDGVSETKTARHIHGISVDRATGYVYATVGDSGTWESPIIVRSTDHGDTWARILNSAPQMVGSVAGVGYRLFGTDVPGSRAALYRTTDDTTYIEVLSVPLSSDCLWIRIDPVTRYVYAGFGGSTATSGTAGIWRSKDSGLTWDQVVALPITAAADGTSLASNIVGGKLIANIVSGGAVVGGNVYRL
jgi:hypothetical protein